MKTSWLLIGLLCLNLILATAGDTSAKLWAITPGHKWLWITLAISIFTTLTYMLVVRESGLAVGSTIMLLLTILSTCLIGFFVFQEQITGTQWIGIALGFVAIFFLLDIPRVR
jgi:drug/metabolite transporter (DMT)-like permease